MTNYLKSILTVTIIAGAFSLFAQSPRVKFYIDGTKSKIPLTAESTAKLNMSNPDWAGENKKNCLSVDGKTALAPAEWQEFEFSFTPDADGEVFLMLQGPWFKPNGAYDIEPVWVCYDSFTALGAELKNGGFEDIGPDGLPVNWQTRVSSILTDKNDAQSGKNYIKAWQRSTTAQPIQVKKGQNVHIKFFAKALL